VAGGKLVGLSYGGFSIGGKKKSACPAFDLRVIDTTSGEIVDIRTIEGYSKDAGVSLGLRKWGIGGVLESEKKTPTGKAIRAAIIESSNYLECSMVKKNRCMKITTPKKSVEVTAHSERWNWNRPLP
jgi:curli biogenesis system outer membrane secretion channel CsgG